MNSRRSFLKGATLAGIATSLDLWPRYVAAEPPPETRQIRLYESPVICVGPQYIAKDLLQSEGFTDVQYVPLNLASGFAQLVSGEVDISYSYIPMDLVHIDAGDPFVILAGGHIGCVELFANSRIRSTRELKGKAVAVSGLRSLEHIFISMFAAHVGLDPQKDINWVIHPWADNVPLFVEGKIDAFSSGPPLSQDLRAKKIGHVLVNTTTDKPWSQYFCCPVSSNKEFVRKHPVATKRALRAILKAADVCALEPKRVARLVADKGLSSYDYAFQMMREIPYGNWRAYDPEDTVRFYALRMHEVGMIKSSPQKMIAQGTDWRFLNELRKELKG